MFTIEPMLVEGSNEVYTWKDGWTVATVDHGRCAQFEHTIIIHKDGAEILTCSVCNKQSIGGRGYDDGGDDGDGGGDVVVVDYGEVMIALPEILLEAVCFQMDSLYLVHCRLESHRMMYSSQSWEREACWIDRLPALLPPPSCLSAGSVRISMLFRPSNIPSHLCTYLLVSRNDSAFYFYHRM